MMFLLVMFIAVAGPAGDKVELPIALKPGVVFINASDCTSAVKRIKKLVPKSKTKLGCIGVAVNGGPKADAF